MNIKFTGDYLNDGYAHASICEYADFDGDAKDFYNMYDGCAFE